MLFFQFSHMAYNTHKINIFVKLFFCLTKAWKFSSAYYKSQTVFSIFARFGIEKYLKFKIQKSNKNQKILLKGFFSQSKVVKTSL